MQFLKKDSLLYTRVSADDTRRADNMRALAYAIYGSVLDDNTKLWPQQQEVTRELAQALVEGTNHAQALIMPTGFGKTVIASQLSKGLLEDRILNQPDKKVIFIADGMEGVRQAREEFAGQAGLPVSVYYGKEKDTTQPIIITTMESAQSANFPIDKADVDLLFIDEGHKAISKARLAMQEKFTSAIIIGLSATPNYTTKRGLLQYYNKASEVTIEEAVHGGSIASFRNILLRSDMDVDLDAIGASISGDYNEKALERALNTEARNRMLNEAIVFSHHPDTGKPLREMTGLISCLNVAHAEDEAEQLNAMFAKYFGSTFNGEAFVIPVNGKTRNRDKIIQWHKDGVVPYLSYADLFLHNYNNPRVEIAANLRPTQSDVVAGQRGGRALRVYEPQPEKIALILDVVDNYSSEKRKFPVLYGHTVGKAAVISENIKYNALKNPNINVTPLGLNGGRQTPKWDEDTKNLIRSANLRMVIDREEVMSVIKNIDQKRIPIKTSDDMTRREAATAMGVSAEEVAIIFNLTVDQWKRHREDSLNVPPPKFMIYPVDSRGNKRFALNKNDLFDFSEEYFSDKANLMKQFLPKKTDQDLTASEISKIYSGNQNDIAKKVKEFFSQIEREKSDLKSVYTSSEEKKIKLKKVISGKTNLPLTLNKNDLANFTARFFPEQLAYILNDNVSEKTDGDFTIKDISKKIHKPYIKVKPVFEAELKIWEKYIIDPISAEKPSVNFKRILTADGYRLPALDLDQLFLFAEKFFPNNINYIKNKNIVPTKTKDDLSPRDISPIISKQPNDIYPAFHVLRKKWDKFNENSDDQLMPVVNLNKVMSGTRPIDTIKSEQLEFFISEYFPDKLSNEKLKIFLEKMKQ